MRIGLITTASILLLVPMPGVADEGTTTSTGDVDVHSVHVNCDVGDDGTFDCQPVLPVCAPAFTPWTVRLTLGETSPGDSVALASVFDSSLAQPAVASHEDPVVQVVGVTRTTCHPDTVVTGLVVSGEVPYTLEFVAH